MIVIRSALTNAERSIRLRPAAARAFDNVDAKVRQRAKRLNGSSNTQAQESAAATLGT
jgi:hypothetical protein